MSDFVRRMCLFHTFRSWRYCSHLPQPEIGQAEADDLALHCNTCSDLLFCELAISELSCRIGDSLPRGRRVSSILKITDAICEVTTGPRPTGFVSVLRPLYKLCQGGAKAENKEDGGAHPVICRNQDCAGPKICWCVGR